MLSRLRWSSSARSQTLSSWSDPVSWGGSVPGPGDVVVVDHPVLLDVDADVAGVVIRDGGSLTFAPGASRTLRTTGNVVVLGTLTMRPASHGVEHELIFEDVDESAFVGGGMSVLDTDVGLWVMDRGKLDVVGSQKRAWTRAAGGIGKGSRRIRLQHKPVGWKVGDEIVITPTASPRKAGRRSFHRAKVKSINGKTVTLTRRTPRKYPRVRLGRRKLTAEVLNLSRNVRIEGTPGGRAHVFVHALAPQVLKHASLRYLGPRQTGGQATEGVMGRYPLHFHLAENGTRGSVVQGVTARDCGNHAFVTHLSHGVSYRDCIAYDVLEDAYWWDEAPSTTEPGPPTHDVTYRRCVAALVSTDPPWAGHQLAGFFIGRGNGNKAIGCVAVGVRGSSNASGFKWPEGSEGVWVFKDCVAHNNDVHGAFVWQSSRRVHTILRFIAYHNGGSGVLHGSYKNNYRYRNCIFHSNRQAQFFAWGLSWSKLRLEDLLLDGGGISDYALILAGRGVVQPSARGRIERCTFRGYRRAAVHCTFDDFGPYSARWDLVNCRYGRREFWFDKGIHKHAVLRVRDARHPPMALRRRDRRGTYVRRWNARKQRIKRFP